MLINSPMLWPESSEPVTNVLTDFLLRESVRSGAGSLEDQDGLLKKTRAGSKQLPQSQTNKMESLQEVPSLKA